MWVPWSKSTLDGLGMFFEYSIPNSVLEVSFLFSLELFVCISGYGIIINPNKHIEKNEFSALTVSMNICTILQILAIGMSYTISAFVGYYQATTKSMIAKKYMKNAVFLGLIVICTNFGLYKIHSKGILKQYLNSPETINKILNKLPPFFGLVIMLATYNMLNGVIKGLGLQSKAVILSMACLYFISLPLCYVLGF